MILAGKLPLFRCSWCDRPIWQLAGMVLRQGLPYCSDRCHVRDSTPPCDDCGIGHGHHLLICRKVFDG